MLRKIGVLWAALAALGLTGCGNNSPTAKIASTNNRGTLVANPALRVASLTAVDFGAELKASTSGQQLLQLAGTPACGVDVYYIKYWTVGPDNSAQLASGALMVPTGASAPCTGPRPIVLYAHGTATQSTYNIADVGDNTNPAYSEAIMLAAVFAAQGDIVVAPNYLGYDISTLGYHPFVDGAANANDMMDALAAARTALLSTFTPATSDSGQLYVTGYSEGGYVAMATVKAMQAAGETVTASAPSSGPYALEAFGDAIFFGQVNIGSTAFAPLVRTSYKNDYGNLHSTAAEVFSATYATGIDSLLPNPSPLATLFQQGKLPQTALFNSTIPASATGNALLDAKANALLALPASPPYAASQAALFDLGFGNPYLINNSYRVEYVDDALVNADPAEAAILANPQVLADPASWPSVLNPTNTALAATSALGLRSDLALNDMRNGGWFPKEPMLLCGGDQDPTVFYQNTLIMLGWWSPYVQGRLVSWLDLNAPPSGGFAPLQAGFQQTYAGLVAAQGAAAIAAYHGTEAPFCMVAARSFFAQVP